MFSTVTMECLLLLLAIGGWGVSIVRTSGYHVSPKPIGFWPMNSETSVLKNGGTVTIYDVSGNANDGTMKLRLIATGPAGAPNTAVRFADFDRIKCSDVRGLDIGTTTYTFTYTGFVKDVLGGNSSIFKFNGGLGIKTFQRQLTVVISNDSDYHIPCGKLSSKWNFVVVRFRQLSNSSEVVCSVDSHEVKTEVQRKTPGTSSTTVYHGVGLGGDMSCVMLFAERLSDTDIKRVKQYCLEEVVTASLQNREHRFVLFAPSHGLKGTEYRPVRNVIVPSMLSCAKMCMEEFLCRSFAYKQSTGTCQLCGLDFELPSAVQTHKTALTQESGSKVFNSG